MDLFSSKVDMKESWFRILYFTYLWIPMRRKLLDDYEKGKFVLIAKTTTPAPQQEVVQLQEQHRPELMDQFLPDINYWGKFYYKFSTSTFIMDFISVSFLFYSGDLKDENYNRIGIRLFGFQCFIPRLVIHEIFQQLVTTSAAYAASLLHLVWRFSILYLEGQFVLNPIMFLLINDETCEILQQNTRTVLETYHQYNRLELTQSVMFYKIEDKLNHVVKFHVRPNRTLEARAKLIEQVGIVTKLSNLIIYLASSLGITTIAYTLFTKPQAAYLGCTIESYNLAHLFRFSGSLIVSSIVLFDTLVTLMYPIFVSYILIFDLMIYWPHVKSMLISHLNSMRQFRANIIHSNAPEVAININNGMGSPNLSYFCCHYKQTGNRKEMVTSLEMKSRELESTVSDFFVQLKEADQYVSIILAWACCIWLGCVAVVFVMGLERHTNVATFILIRNVQFSGLMILLTLTVLTLALKRATEPAYGIICSIMACDPTIEKRRWESMLAYFTGRKPKHAFTILHSRIYTLTLFLEIFSYTFTFGLYLQTFGIVDLGHN